MPAVRRVAVVIPRYGRMGGAERYAWELTERLSRDERYEFHVFANRWEPGSGRVRVHKVPVIRFPRFLRPISFAWGVSRMMGADRFDLVHSHERIFRADVFSVHSIPHGDWVRQVRKKRMSLFDRATDWIERSAMGGGGNTRYLSVSSLAKEAFLRRYNVEGKLIHVIHPGVDLERFAGFSREECRRQIREKYGIGKLETLVLFVGMNFEIKGLDVVIAAVADAGKMYPGASFRLLVVGKGDYRKYRGAAERLGIGDRVIFAGPQQREVERFYIASDVMAILSSFDTFGIVVLEAMAAGLPVIVSSKVGARDVVDDGINGFVVQDPRDVGATARALVRLCEDSRRAEMANAAIAAVAVYSWDAVAEKVRAVYEEVLS